MAYRSEITADKYLWCVHYIDYYDMTRKNKTIVIKHPMTAKKTCNVIMQLTFSWKLSNAKKFKIRQDTFNNILVKT